MTDKKKKRPTRREVRSEIDDLRSATGDDPDGPDGVTINHVKVELPDEAKVDPDDPDGGPQPDPPHTTPNIEGVTRRIEAEHDRETGEWDGSMWVDDDAVDLPVDDPDNDGGEQT